MANISITESLDLPKVRQAVDTAAPLILLPKKSGSIYEKEYECFKEWCRVKNVNNINEEVLLSYFFEKSKLLKSSSIWSKYSMLKSTISIKDGVDISKYLELKAFLKKESAGYKCKKGKVFTREEVNSFLLEAPDSKYLLMKVVFIMGLYGACRREELCKLTVDNVQDMGSLFVVKTPDTNTNMQRTFTIPDNECNDSVNPAAICRKYASLRPKHLEHKRFFIQYKDGKCTVHGVGINQFSRVPCLIAEFLKLPNSELYTGHSLRRSSGTVLVGAGVGIQRLKRWGGWKLPTVAEQYLKQFRPIEENNEIVMQDPEVIEVNYDANEIIECDVSTSPQSSVPDDYILPRGITGTPQNERESSGAEKGLDNSSSIKRSLLKPKKNHEMMGGFGACISETDTPPVSNMNWDETGTFPSNVMIKEEIEIDYDPPETIQNGSQSLRLTEYEERLYNLHKELHDLRKKHEEELHTMRRENLKLENQRLLLQVELLKKKLQE